VTTPRHNTATTWVGQLEYDKDCNERLIDMMRYYDIRILTSAMNDEAKHEVTNRVTMLKFGTGIGHLGVQMIPKKDPIPQQENHNQSTAPASTTTKAATP
jgi:hypothetical protein